MDCAPLSSEFNATGDRYRIQKYSDVTLLVQVSTGASTVYMTYDFVSRVLISQSGSTGSSAPNITPFSQLDRESLEYMHAQLVKLEGKPPALPAEKDDDARTPLAKPRAPR